MFLSRDLDSFLSLRDAAAVQDWLQNTTKPFTTFRDHKDHNYPILAGLFGARTNQLSEDFRKSKLKTIISLANKNNPNTLRKIYDQEILRDVLFLPNLKLFVTYDSYSCETWAMFSMVRPFPTKRNGTEFLGSTELWQNFST
ncbi:hypothetical protein Ocin01_07794 [Orchesella cincta]|uniref:Uncharacterized protein n=1 Tax=Orchesella cincta TaxID=48709 RepID=A0A1D2N0S2_ORCCI|nr:hypothetical protein Ocin01_07794 [Orchesella cincta]